MVGIQFRKSVFRWPRQTRPPASNWRLWKLATDTVWSNFGTHVVSMGTWMCQPHKSWLWYHDLATHALYQEIVGDGIMKYDELPHLQRRTRYYFSPFGETTEHLPITACPVIPVWSSNAYCCTEGYPIPRPPPIPAHQTFHSVLDSMDNVTKRWLQYSFFQDDAFQSILKLLVNDAVIIIVDGSFLPESGVATAAWVLAGNEGEIPAVGYSRLPDDNIQNDPCRAGIFGLCLALSVLRVFYHYDPTITGKVVISCDIDEALRHGIEYDLWPRSHAPHFDLLAIVHRFRQELPFRLIPRRVAGHQNRLGRELNRLEELNMVADDAARTIAHQVERNRNIQHDMTSMPRQWRVSVGDRIIKKDVRNYLKNSILGQRMITHWIEKNKFNRERSDRIDWESIQHSTKWKPLHHRRWATKFISGFCGSFYKLHQMGKHPTPLCPRYNLFEETTAHILFCRHHSSKQHRLDSLKELEQWFDNTQTRWDIRDTILASLRDLHPTIPLHTNVPFNPFDDSIFLAARSQDSIGLQNFLEGFISKEWKIIMEHYYRDIRSTRTATSWAAGLHMNLQKYARAQWDHRNAVVHARNTKGRKLTSEKEIKSRLEYQLSMGIQYLPTHLHHLANFNLEKSLSEPRSKMLAWLHHLEVVRPFYEETETREVNTQRVFFRHWLRI